MYSKSSDMTGLPSIWLQASEERGELPGKALQVEDHRHRLAFTPAGNESRLFKLLIVIGRRSGRCPARVNERRTRHLASCVSKLTDHGESSLVSERAKDFDLVDSRIHEFNNI